MAIPDDQFIREQTNASSYYNTIKKGMLQLKYFLEYQRAVNTARTPFAKAKNWARLVNSKSKLKSMSQAYAGADLKLRALMDTLAEKVRSI